MSAGCSSNCGLTSISSSPPSASSGASAGSTSVSEMNDRSPTIRSKLAAAARAAPHQMPRVDAFQRRHARIAAQLRDAAAHGRRRCPPPRRAARSSTSVKPPVLWPTSRQVLPLRPTRRASAPSSFSPPRDTQRSSASSVTCSSQPSAARRRLARLPPSRAGPPRSARRPRDQARACAAEREGETALHEQLVGAHRRPLSSGRCRACRGPCFGTPM